MKYAVQSSIFLAFLSCGLAKPNSKSSEVETSALANPTLSNELHINSEMLTLENFENLLRQAVEIFYPLNMQFSETKSGTQQQQQQIPVPLQQIQAPPELPFNFYLPLFEVDSVVKRDEKSLKMEHFSPPPEQQKNNNYYAAKPRKVPKKFIGDSKQANLNWAFDLDKKADGQLGGATKVVYLVNDGRNRINFDGTFFDVDMLKKVVHNESNKELSAASKEKYEPATHLIQGERMSEEEDDLLATPSEQLRRLEYTNKDDDRSE